MHRIVTLQKAKCRTVNELHELAQRYSQNPGLTRLRDIHKSSSNTGKTVEPSLASTQPHAGRTSVILPAGPLSAKRFIRGRLSLTYSVSVLHRARVIGAWAPSTSLPQQANCIRITVERMEHMPVVLFYGWLPCQMNNLRTFTRYAHLASHLP